MRDWPEVQLVFKGNSDAGPPAARYIVLTPGHPYSSVCKVTQNFFLCLELYFLDGLKLGFSCVSVKSEKSNVYPKDPRIVPYGIVY